MESAFTYVPNDDSAEIGWDIRDTGYSFLDLGGSPVAPDKLAQSLPWEIETQASSKNHTTNDANPLQIYKTRTVYSVLANYL
jgi:hypothetical protein